MTQEYKVGDVAKFEVNWLKQTSEAATVTGTPTITILRYDYVGNSFDTRVNAANMTLESGSKWYYEFDTSSETAGYDFTILYEAVVDGLNVEASEVFRVTDTFATEADIRELREGNERIDFTIATSVDTVRKVLVGMVDSITFYTKADGDSDWSSPTSTKTVYLWYNDNKQCIARKEDG